MAEVIMNIYHHVMDFGNCKRNNFPARISENTISQEPCETKLSLKQTHNIIYSLPRLPCVMCRIDPGYCEPISLYLAGWRIVITSLTKERKDNERLHLPCTVTK